MENEISFKDKYGGLIKMEYTHLVFEKGDVIRYKHNYFNIISVVYDYDEDYYEYEALIE